MESNIHGWNRNPPTVSNETNDTLQKSIWCYPFGKVDLDTVGYHTPYILNATVNVFGAVLAITSNILVLLATRKANSIHLPSKLLLFSLIFTDLGVGMIAQPFFAAFLIARMAGYTRAACLCRKVVGVAGSMLSSTALSTMTVIGLDRYAALFFHFKYNEIVTIKRVGSILVFLWISSGFLSSTLLRNMQLFSFIVLSLTPLSFCIISSAYILIYKGLQHNHTGTPLNATAYRRSASNMLWIYGLFILCYLPYFIGRVCITFVRNDVLMHLIFEFCMTFVYINSSLDPFLYCARLHEIRVKVLEIIRKVFNQSSQQVT